MLGILMDGGWLMLPLVLCSIAVVAIIIDRTRAFRAAGTDHEQLRKTMAPSTSPSASLFAIVLDRKSVV